MTATAGPKVIQDISNTLGIHSDESPHGAAENILVIDKSRDNIDVSCQFVETHEERLEMVRTKSAYSVF